MHNVTSKKFPLFIKTNKDLTTSWLDRQNILNNELAVEEIQIKSGMEGILWEGKVFVTREMTVSF